MNLHELLALVVIGLATYRATRAWTTDSLFEGTQARLDAHFQSNGEVYPVTDEHGRVRWWPTVAKDKVLTLLTCPLCVSYWFGVLLLWLWFERPPWEWSLRSWITSLAVAAVPTVVFRWESSLD